MTSGTCNDDDDVAYNTCIMGEATKERGADIWSFLNLVLVLVDMVLLASGDSGVLVRDFLYVYLPPEWIATNGFPDT